MRGNLFQINGYVKEPLILPEGSGPPVIHSEKVYVPVKEHPDVSIIILFIFKIICFSIPSLSFYLSHNFSQYLCFQEVTIDKYCSYCPSEIPIVTILRRKKIDFFMKPVKVSVHCGKQEAGGGNFLSKLLRKNFEK